MKRKRNSWAGLLALAAPAATAALAALAWRHLMRTLRPPNPELAALHGLELVRGPKRVLAVTAHPDDLEAAAGGTLRLMSLAGSTIDVAVLSDGGRQNNSRPDLGQVRAFEQDQAATILGYTRVHNLGWRDLSLSGLAELEPALAGIWSKVKPDIVLAFDPNYPAPHVAHPDHLAGGRVTLNLAGTDLGRGALVYLYATGEPRVVVDITPVIEDKVRAVLSHRSQLKAPAVLYDAGIRWLAKLSGRQVQLPYAETFRALELPPLPVRAVRAQWPDKPVVVRTSGRNPG